MVDICFDDVLLHSEGPLFDGNVCFRVTLTRLGKDARKAVAKPRVTLQSTASTSCDILRKESSVM